MPDGPWIMTQTWHDLLFAHWPVDKVHLAETIPRGLELDLYEGEAWLGIVPFHMTNVRPRGVPALPWVSEFPELNVRTYVRVGGKAGVFFFSLDAGSPLAVAAARAIFDLPYYLASMEVEARDGTVHYNSRRTSAGAGEAVFIASYQPTGEVFHGRAGSLEFFLTERYCLYTVDHEFRVRRLDIHHPPWRLQPAEAVFEVNTMTEPIGLRLPSRAPVVHFVKRQDTVAWRSRRVDVR